MLRCRPCLRYPLGLSGRLECSPHRVILLTKLDQTRQFGVNNFKVRSLQCTLYKRKESARNPIRRVWKLRERMLRLGIDFGNDDERIRKVVGGPQRGER